MSRQEDQNRYSRERYQKLKERGMCTDCAKEPAEQGKTMCRKCLDHRIEYNHRHYAIIRTEYNITRSIKLRDLKADVIGHYGGRCACCGEIELDFLVIDHVNGGGNVHRRDMGMTAGAGTYRWLRKNGYPAGFQVLCCNCNQSKGIHGVCIHQYILAIK